MKKQILILHLWLFTTVTTRASFGQDRIIDDLKGSSLPLVNVIVNYTEYILYFLYFIAVVYGIYGGFLILTSAGDDDKFDKGKRVIFQAIIGLVVIFIAGPLASFFLGGNGDVGLLQQ